MKRLLLIPYFSSLLLVPAKGQITIKEVIANENRNGEVLLEQGYKGRLKVLVGEDLASDDFEDAFEFTHATLNDKGHFLEAPKAQGICVGIDVGSNKFSSRFPAIHFKDLPEINLITSSKTMEDLIKVLGIPRSTIPGIAKENARSISTGWDFFTILEDGSIDVISVFVISKREGEQWIINDRRVARGVFRPTGLRPRLEKKRPKKPDMATPNQPPD